MVSTTCQQFWHKNVITRVQQSKNELLNTTIFTTLFQRHRWCNGYHPGFPFPGSGFDSRTVHDFNFFSFFHFSGQNLITYVMLAVTYLSLFCCQRRSSNGSSDSKPNLWTVFKRRGIRYFFLAVVDVEANYLVHRAFHYTTLTSVQVHWY